MEAAPTMAIPADLAAPVSVSQEVVDGVPIGHFDLPNGKGHDEAVQVVDQQVAGMVIGAQSESDLHRPCAEGKLEEVRAVLSRGLENLEMLDMTTGCTPIVLAIRNNHVDVVRELLAAGAIVPPPGLTSDPLLLSILYPQPIYGMPPFMGQAMSMGGPEFYPQPGFFPQDGQRGFMAFAAARKEGSPGGQGQQGNGAGNLPPTEVAKTIPCRNFPNCKYGASCVFFHPRPQSGYYPQLMSNGFVPGGFDQTYAPFQPNGMPMNGGYYPQPAFNPTFPLQSQNQIQEQDTASQSVQQSQQQQYQPSQTEQSEIPDEATTQHDQTPTQNQTQAQPVRTPAHAQLSALSAFVPSFQPGAQPTPLSPPPTSQFGISPMSPSMLAGSLPSIPPAEAFFAASPPNGTMLPPIQPNGFVSVPGMNGHNRRQSFNNPAFGAPVKPFGHGKKPSFSGGPRPWAPRASVPNGTGSLGTWKDGNPPPCAFFSQGKCRNGEFCKFPHFDAEGNDCRHPDIVRGIIPPLPSLSRQPRNMRMGNNFGPFDPAFRHQQHMAFVQQRTAQPNGEAEVSPSTGAASESATEANKAETTVESAAATSDRPALPASVPPKPIAVPIPPIIRSASQPGVQRVHVNGVSSRSHSPAPSNVSFHGNGHPRRAGSRAPFNGPAHGQAHGSRSASAGAETKSAPQRVPRADEFPALGGAGERKEAPVANGKTAAQVLSEPAPPKPVLVKVAQVDGEDNASVSSKSDSNSITMDSEPDSDAVIISHKPSTATTPASGSTSPLKRAAVSFASVAGAVAPAGAPLEPAPVGVKA